MLLFCDCGGEFLVTTLASYNFTPISGLSSELQNVRGLRCYKCEHVTLEGRVIQAALNILVFKIAGKVGRLSSDQSIFLRKHLGLSQQKLADRMKVSRATVARWENGEEISPEYDQLLRTMAVDRCTRIIEDRIAMED